MRITVKLFAILRDEAGVGELLLDLPADSDVAYAVDRTVKQFPSIGDHLARAAYAVNREYAKPETALHDGDELALIPPVSGG